MDIRLIGITIVVGTKAIVTFELKHIELREPITLYIKSKIENNDLNKAVSTAKLTLKDIATQIVNELSE